MRNFAVKFALLTARFTLEKPDPQAYIELTPAEMLQQYKQGLTITDRGVLLFGFSDAAIVAILDEEFELDLDRGLLLFRKTFLNARSIRLAGMGDAGPEGLRFSVKEQALLEHVSIRLLETTRHLYRYDISDARLEDIRQEYEENIRCYLQRSTLQTSHQPGEHIVTLRSLLASDKSLRAFCHAMTADALFKMDAAKVLFGENSAYYQAWYRKQIFRYTMAKAMTGVVTGCVLE